MSLHLKSIKESASDNQNDCKNFDVNDDKNYRYSDLPIESKLM